LRLLQRASSAAAGVAAAVDDAVRGRGGGEVCRDDRGDRGPFLRYRVPGNDAVLWMVGVSRIVASHATAVVAAAMDDGVLLLLLRLCQIVRMLVLLILSLLIRGKVVG